MGSWIFNRQNGSAVNLEQYSSIRWFKDEMVIEFCRKELRDFPGEKGADYQGPPPDSTAVHVDGLEWTFQSEIDFDQTLRDLLAYLEAAQIGAD